eukprot:GFKZ01000230.1.p1 GENE.GFKZ01000230.1~~GFKZ01000230.1.p1  ORF type:complete len:290 (+),score=42.98 GFKZ01000230.1:335-1204(+)
MRTPAFATPFTGVSPARLRPSLASSVPRCAMGDSLAPEISITDTKSDQTSKLAVSMVPVPPRISDAVSIQANVALFLSLKSKINVPSPSPASTTPPPANVSPSDLYFPVATRNQAPTIEFPDNAAISVKYEKIDSSVAGVTADSVDSIAFWKKPAFKYDAPPASDSAEAECLSTALYEKYYPSKIRNLAPVISMNPPGPFDTITEPYLKVSTAFVPLNTEAAREISVERPPEDSSLKAAAVIAKYYSDDVIYKAPQILINRQKEQVEFSLAEVPEPVTEAEKILAAVRD